jgi:hypothetical protein
MGAVIVGGILAIAGGVLATFVGIAADGRRRAQAARDQRQSYLRDVYLELVRSARRSRESSLRCASLASAAEPNRAQLVEVQAEAKASHDDFVEQYHHWYLVVSDSEMWDRARELRRVLDDMLDAAIAGDAARAERDAKPARRARQNLANNVRVALGFERLQSPKTLPPEFTISD